MQPGSDEHELAHRFATVAQEQLPLTRDWLQHVFTMHFRQMLRNEAVTLQERDAAAAATRARRRSRSPTSSASPSWGRASPSEELGDVASRLQRLAGDVVQSPVRLVKTIGDAVMLVAPEPKDMLADGARAGRARRGDRGHPRAAGRHRLRPGRQPVGRLVRQHGQPRQPPHRPRPPGLGADHRGGPRGGGGGRLQVVLGRPEEAQGLLDAGQDVQGSPT